MYDLQQDRFLWGGDGNAQAGTLTGNIAVLNSLRSSELYDAESGALIRDSEPGLQIVKRPGEDVALCLTKDSFSRLDLATGKRVWSKTWKGWHGYCDSRVLDDQVFVVGDGLQVQRIEDGTGWTLAASTYHSGEAEALAKDVAATVLFAMVGGMYIGHSQAKVTHNLSSLALVRGDRVYYAATKQMYCVDRETGTVLWQAELPHELGSMTLYNAGPNVALVGTGWKYVNFAKVHAWPPCIQLFEAMSGDTAGRFEAEKSEVFSDFRWADSACYFLTPSRLYRLGSDLTLKGARECTPEQGQFVRFMKAANPLAVRTTKGVLGLETSSLDVMWYRDLGDNLTEALPPPKLVKQQGHWPEAFLATKLKQREDAQSWSVGNCEWLSGTRSYAAIDVTHQGVIMRELPLTGRHIYAYEGGHLLNFDKNVLTVYTLGNRK
jgi:hypothetical protein